MTSSPDELLVTFVSVAIMMVALRLFAERFERGRRLTREMYTNASYPHYMRVGILVTPLGALSALLFGISGQLPRAFGAAALTTAIVVAGIAFMISYRVPPPFMPGWMREEIEDGRLELVRPEGIDWLQFWIVVPFIVLTPFAAIYLILSGSAGP